MRLAVNTSFLLQDQWTGVMRHMYYQLLAMAKVRPDHEIVMFFLVPKAMKKLYDSLNFPPNVKKVPVYIPQRLREPIDKLWQRLKFPNLELLVGPLDVYLSPAWSYLPTHANVKGLWVYDLTVFDQQTTSINKSMEINRLLTAKHTHADIWIVISEYTKQKLKQKFNLDDQQIVCAYPGLVSTLTKKIPRVSQPEPNFLYYGSGEERKNLNHVLHAFNDVHANYPNHTFTIVSKDAEVLKQQYTYPWLTILPYADDNQLLKLISKAEGLIYVPLEEGFGMPVLEALSGGLPVITTARSSMTEITGNNWPWLADARSHMSICETIQKFLHAGVDERIAAVQSVQSRIAKFNFDASADTIWKSLEQIV